MKNLIGEFAVFSIRAYIVCLNPLIVSLITAVAAIRRAGTKILIHRIIM